MDKSVYSTEKNQHRAGSVLGDRPKFHAAVYHFDPVSWCI